MNTALYESSLKSLPRLGRGKVRDIYRVDALRLLIVATDRLSAFDVVMQDPIPGKGMALTQISNHWFAFSSALVPNHLVETSFDRFRKLEHRRREAWVLEAQSYLNHALREEHAKRFIRPSLDLLRDIQRTGDIFFPKRWMDATLSGHSSAAASRMVSEFLASLPNGPAKFAATSPWNQVP